ncbi:MAG: rod-binding protein [Spirochaetaceae bacterium]|jgi:flagellar protein FlgJ|nr:rod-binding protein [Spirochaetaceae bacterium]
MESMAQINFSNTMLKTQAEELKRFSSYASGGAVKDERTAGGGFAAMLKEGGAQAESGETAKSKKPFVDKNDKLYEQCEALETFLLKTLVNGMRKTVEKSGFTKPDFAGEMYEDMLYDEYAKTFSKNAGFGLAELAYIELTGQRNNR